MSRRPRREPPGPGQESVWDYPRPPRAEACEDRIVVLFGGEVLVDTTRSVRVLETSHPPVHYVSMADVRPGALEPSPRSSMCEFKGAANYLNVAAGNRRELDAGWTYPHPAPGFASLVDHVALYPSKMDAVELAGERVVPQDGDFYGGWVTSRVAGPFKGPPGTWGW